MFAGVLSFGAAFGAEGDPRRAGDVLGRDLDYPGLGSFGHLGIYGGSRVLECLNEPKPIQKNSLHSFKTLTKYWGARYIPGKHDFRKVVAKGWAQRNFDPSFTLSWDYQKGRYLNKKVWNPETREWETRTEMVPAKFRCDTFVRFAFKEGIGIDLGAKKTLPSIVFGNCPEAR
jgi:hypothetical protein